MEHYIYVFFLFELFQTFLMEFYRRGSSTQSYGLSSFERSLWVEKSTLYYIISTLLVIARINGIIFLVYLAFNVSWYHPIILWLSCMVISAVIINIYLSLPLGRTTGLTIPSMLSVVILPITIVYLWLIF